LTGVAGVHFRMTDVPLKEYFGSLPGISMLKKISSEVCPGFRRCRSGGSLPHY